MNMYLYTWKPSRSTWKCCFPSPAPCSSVCEHQVFLTDADITRYFPTHPWWRIWAFPVTKLSKNPTDNHTGKLRVLTMLTINTLILEPKASMLFTESLLAIFKHLSNWGGESNFSPFPPPKEVRIAVPSPTPSFSWQSQHKLGLVRVSADRWISICRLLPARTRCRSICSGSEHRTRTSNDSPELILIN